MSSTARGLSSYRTTQVQSRTPLELVVMLYDGALKFMGTARDAIERRDIPARRDALSRTLAIISELQSTLNLAEGETRQGPYHHGHHGEPHQSLYRQSHRPLLPLSRSCAFLGVRAAHSVTPLLRAPARLVLPSPPICPA